MYSLKSLDDHDQSLAKQYWLSKKLTNQIGKNLSLLNFETVSTVYYIDTRYYLKFALDECTIEMRRRKLDKLVQLFIDKGVKV